MTAIMNGLGEPCVPVGPPGFHIGDPGRAYAKVRPLLVPHDRATGLVIGGGLGPPDTVMDAGRIGALEIRAASVRGLWHRHDGRARQDDYGLCVDPSGRWLVAAVADGVSAGPLSHEAAQAVARLGSREVAGRLAGDGPVGLDWAGIFAWLAGLVVRVGLRSLARSGNDGVDAAEVARHMATTAAFAVCPAYPSVETEVVVAWWGDSSVWAMDRERRWRCLTEVKNAGAEIHTSAVAALPHLPEPPGTVPVRREVIDASEVLVLMTDGVGDPLGDGTGDVAAALARAWVRPPSPLDFVAQVGFGRRSFDDDRTAVALWLAEHG